MALTLPNTQDVVHLAQRFLACEPDTRCHVLYCSNVHRALLASGDVTALPHMPLCLFNVSNQHWVATLPQSMSAVHHIPIPLTCILTD